MKTLIIFFLENKKGRKGESRKKKGKKEGRKGGNCKNRRF